MGREEQVRDAKCTRPSLPVEGLAPRLSPLSPKVDAGGRRAGGGRHFWRVMVVKITSLEENGRQTYKFHSPKNRSGILL